MKYVIFLFMLFISKQHSWAAIYDCFTFFNEIELLKVRLEEINEVIDYFVLVEGDQTYGGEKKPLYFLENRHLFERYLHKIIHVVVNDFPNPTGNIEDDNWARQIHTRLAKMRGLIQCKNDDLIILGDLDEIPNTKAILESKAYFSNHPTLDSVNGDIHQMICEFHMRLFRFQLNRQDPINWEGGVKMTPYWVLKEINPWEIQILHMYDRKIPKIYNAGNHFSSQGGAERVLSRRKCHGAYCTQLEFFEKCDKDPDFLKRAIQEELEKFPAIEIDDDFPKFIRENLDYFKTIGWIAEVKK